MGRSWKDVKADKSERDNAAGRDLVAAHSEARLRTEAYVAVFRLGQLRQEAGSVVDFEDQ